MVAGVGPLARPERGTHERSDYCDDERLSQHRPAEGRTPTIHPTLTRLRLTVREAAIPCLPTAAAVGASGLALRERGNVA